MRIDNLVDSEFSYYLNRHVTGILKLSELVEKVVIKYELKKSFGREKCNFIIGIKFIDQYDFTDKQKLIANKYLFNYGDNSGYKYASFVYHGQNSDIDYHKIKEFLRHYQFAKDVFEGVVKEYIPDIKLEIYSVDKEPLFNYAKRYFLELEFIDQESPKTRSYSSAMNNRSFSKDIVLHSLLVDASKNFNLNISTITDIEICKNTQTDIGALRELVLDNDIPFQINEFSDTIEELAIDYFKLKDFMVKYSPERYVRVYPEQIMQLMYEREN
jgi:hypothetical protein